MSQHTLSVSFGAFPGVFFARGPPLREKASRFPLSREALRRAHVSLLIRLGQMALPPPEDPYRHPGAAKLESASFRVRPGVCAGSARGLRGLRGGLCSAQAQILTLAIGPAAFRAYPMARERVTEERDPRDPYGPYAGGGGPTEDRTRNGKQIGTGYDREREHERYRREDWYPFKCQVLLGENWIRLVPRHTESPVTAGEPRSLRSPCRCAGVDFFQPQMQPNAFARSCMLAPMLGSFGRGSTESVCQD